MERELKGTGLPLLDSLLPVKCRREKPCPVRADGARNAPCLGHAICLCQGRELGVDSCRDELEGTTHAGGVSSGCVAGLCRAVV